MHQINKLPTFEKPVILFGSIIVAVSTTGIIFNQTPFVITDFIVRLVTAMLVSTVAFLLGRGRIKNCESDVRLKKTKRGTFIAILVLILYFLGGLASLQAKNQQASIVNLEGLNYPDSNLDDESLLHNLLLERDEIAKKISSQLAALEPTLFKSKEWGNTALIEKELIKLKDISKNLIELRDKSKEIIDQKIKLLEAHIAKSEPGNLDEFKKGIGTQKEALYAYDTATIGLNDAGIALYAFVLKNQDFTVRDGLPSYDVSTKQATIEKLILNINTLQAQIEKTLELSKNAEALVRSKFGLSL